jgi:hypothetical protein
MESEGSLPCSRDLTVGFFLSQIHPLYSLKDLFFFFNIHFDILTSTPKSTKSFFHSAFPTQNCIWFNVWNVIMNLTFAVRLFTAQVCDDRRGPRHLEL